jgi:hypothetical protein
LGRWPPKTELNLVKIGEAHGGANLTIEAGASDLVIAAPPGRDPNPFPFRAQSRHITYILRGILPPDLASEIAQVYGEVQFIFNEARNDGGNCRPRL